MPSLRWEDAKASYTYTLHYYRTMLTFVPKENKTAEIRTIYYVNLEFSFIKLKKTEPTPTDSVKVKRVLSLCRAYGGTIQSVQWLFYWVGRPKFDSQERKILPLSQCLDQLWDPPTSYPKGAGIFFLWVKLPGLEADQSPPPSA